MTNNAKHRESIKPTPSENLLFELADDLGTVAEPQAQLAAQAALAAARHVLGALNGRGGLPAPEQPSLNTQHLAIIEQKSSLALTMVRSMRSVIDRHEVTIGRLQAADQKRQDLEAQIARLDQQLATLQARQEKLRTLDQDLADMRTQLAELPNLPEIAEKAFSAWARAEKEAKTRQRVSALERTIAARDRQKAILRRKHLGDRKSVV